MGCAATLRHNRAISRLSKQNLLQQHRYYVLKMSVNDFGLCIMENPSVVRRY